jgi:hypothetical protein
MKHLFLIFMALIFSASVYSQAVPDPVSDGIGHEFVTPAEVITPDVIVIEAKTIDGIFETFLALVAFIPIAVQFLRKLLIPNAASIGVQIFSWVVGIVITIAGWLLHLGFLDGLSFWLALLYGIGACLAANGIFDTGLITAIFSLFAKKQQAKV